jgi:predicted transcriptional regulator of viral defense system
LQTYCNMFLKMEKYSNLGKWVEDLPKRGKRVFSKQEVEDQFSTMSYYNLRNSLNRLSKKKKIESVWRDFYTVILPEYGLTGVAPPIEYIDQLMTFLSTKYYVALLSAAALQGASHQAPMEFFVITDSKVLRDKQKNDIKINFVTKKSIPTELINQIMVNSGYVNVSSPELTAIDLITYEKNIGGIQRVATILSELVETMNIEKFSESFLKTINVSVIQRLGYLLELLEYNDLSENFLEKVKKTQIKFRKYPLSILSEKKNYSEFPYHEKWKIFINENIEIDEL